MSSPRHLARCLASSSLNASFFTTPTRWLSPSIRSYSSSNDVKSTEYEPPKSTAKPNEEVKPKKKTQAELDMELQLKMQGMAGDGGDAGIEFEDGQPVSMKRSVKNNMFRYI